MDHNNIIKNVIARSVPGTFSANAQRVFLLADKYTSAQIRGYLFQVYNYNVKAKMDLNYPLTLQTDAQGLTIPELVRAAYAARDEQIVTTVTTFNVSKVLQEQGYNQEVHQKIESEDLGVTLPVGVDKTPFPKDNVRGYMKFTSSADFFYLPIHGQFINTNFFRKKDIVKPIFIGPLIETAFLFASFSSLVNGKVVKVQVGDAGSKLLGFEEMLGRKYSMGMDVITANLESWLASISAPSGKKWENTTLHGDEWAHTIYQIFVKQSHNDDFLPTLVDAVSTFVQIQEEDGTTSSMLSFDDQGDLVIQSVPLVLCMQLRGMQLNIEKRIVTLHQAYAALDLARLVRGHDKSKKGTLSRVALFGCNIEPGLAEISYMATNINRFIGKGDIILFVDEGKTSGQIINFLQALVILEYKGRVFLKVTPSIIGSLSPSPNVVTDVIDDLYRFGAGEFDIVGCSPINLVTKTWYYDQEGVLLPDRPYIFDLRTFATTGNSPDLLEASVKREFISRYAEWSHWIYPVVSRAKIFTGIYAFDNLICCTGVELHNLVVWTLHSKPEVTGYKLIPAAQYKKDSEDGILVKTIKYLLYEDDSWYYILDDKTLNEVLAASVLTNIARCNRPFIRCSPTTVLKFYDFRFPILIKKGLGKIGVSATSFKIIKILEERNATPKDVLEAFRKSDTVSKAAIMSHPQYGQLLNHALNEGTSQGSVVSETTTVSNVRPKKKLLMVDDGTV